MTILPLTYLSNVEYFSHLLGDGACVVDIGENYVKQSYRNRCDIMAAGGVGMLTVNVAVGGSGTKKPVKDVRIDYSKRWQHQHRMALISAYKSSPYFDHYWERFAPLYEKKYTFLADLNAELLCHMAEIIEPGLKIVFSENYIISSEANSDLRGKFEPIKRSRLGPQEESAAGGIISGGLESMGGVDAEGIISDGEAADTGGVLYFEPYWQVFSDKHPFAANLSSIDLIFCEGPAASGIIRRSS